MFKKRRSFLLTFIVSLFCLYTNTYAATPAIAATDNLQPTPNSWHFLFAPYGWFSSIKGKVTVKGITKTANIPFSQVLQDLDFAGEAHLEANYNRITFMLDPTYLKLAQDVDEDRLKTTLQSKTTLVDTGIFYRLLSTAPHSNPYVALELLGGARYFGAKNELDFDRLPNLNVASTTQAWSPIVGGRIIFEPAAKSELWLRGDIGGFNVDHVHRTWSATAGFSYIIHRHIKLGVAYRALDIEFTQKAAAVNLLIHGPMLGIGFYS